MANSIYSRAPWPTLRSSLPFSGVSKCRNTCQFTQFIIPSNHQRQRRNIMTAVPPSSHNTTSTPPPKSSIDPTEVSHFNALASSWWDPHGPSRLLHLMNPLRHTFINSCLKSQNTPSPSHKLDYLDIGCGGGIFAESAARLSGTKSVTALDPSSEVLKIAQAHQRRDPILMREGKLTYKNYSIESHPIPTAPNNGYDIVTIFEVLEHVSSPSQFLTTVLPHVKPGGWLILSTIARTWTSWAVTKVVAEDVLGIVPRGTHDWNKYINERELREWFGKREGWESPRALGVVYVPGLGWREVPGSEGVGNYFFGVRRKIEQNESKNESRMDEF